MSDQAGPSETASARAPYIEVDETTARKAATAALVGTAMEWYDFFLFTTAAAIVFNVQYFHSEDPAMATIQSFATMGVGFVARPIGAFLFGHLGDRIGRKAVLMITIIGIGVATGLIGLLPTYFQIGIWAPIALVALRIVQGLAVGGEWGGAVTVAVENAPPAKRARYAVFPQIGSPIGTLMSSGGFFLMAVIVPTQAFDAWGWRIPFLAAIPLLLVAVYIRKQLEESPIFRELEEAGEKESAPVLELFRKSFPQVLVGMGANFLGVGGFFLVTTFVVSYGTGVLGMTKPLMLGATLAAAAIEIVVLIYFGRLAERLGVSRVAVIGSVATIVIAFPIFLMIESTAPVLVILGVTIGVACLSIPYAVNGALTTALFPPSHRLSGVAISANLSAMVSGFVPMLATVFLAATDNAWWPAPAMLAVIAAITGICSLIAPRVSEDIPGYLR